MTDTTPEQIETAYASIAAEQATSRKRGPKRRYDSLVLVQAHITQELRDWFETLPGNSNHERMQWIKDQIEDAHKWAAQRG